MWQTTALAPEMSRPPAPWSASLGHLGGVQVPDHHVPGACLGPSVGDPSTGKADGGSHGAVHELKQRCHPDGRELRAGTAARQPPHRISAVAARIRRAAGADGSDRLAGDPRSPLQPRRGLAGTRSGCRRPGGGPYGAGGTGTAQFHAGGADTRRSQPRQSPPTCPGHTITRSDHQTGRSPPQSRRSGSAEPR